MNVHDLKFEESLSPSTEEIDFLTEQINKESRSQNITSDAFPFGIFVKTTVNDATSNQCISLKERLEIVGGCNGSIVYGSIYTDQLWVHPDYRGKGLGKMIMKKVHDMGKKHGCTFATVGTMDFQKAQKFYEKLGYIVEFERLGYSNGGKMIYLRKNL